MPNSISNFDTALEFFKAIVDSTDDAIVSKTIDGTITSWNPAAQAIFGYTPAEMIGKSIYTLIPPERRCEEEAIVAKLRKGERVSHFETQRLHKDGRLLDVSVTVSPIHDDQGSLLGASKIARNITEQKAVQARVQLLSQVFVHTGEAVVITDPLGHILEVNDAFTRITGYEYGDVIGVHPACSAPAGRGRSSTPICGKPCKPPAMRRVRCGAAAKTVRPMPACSP